MKPVFVLRRAKPVRQGKFDFAAQRGRHDRAFKWAIVLVTLAVIASMFTFLPRGRYLAQKLEAEARQLARAAVGLEKPREEIDADWKRFRQRSIDESHAALVQGYANAGADAQRLMRYAGMDPDHGLLRWGNYDRTLLLPSKVFEADDEGRSYRLIPNTKSIWVRNVSIKSGVLMFFLVPDTPQLGDALRGTGGIPVETSRQTTNSWGLRGPEPDTKAELRGIILGDSFMQGMFIADQSTPPECLRRYLEAKTGKRVSLLNTGNLGYSPEQYYYALMKFVDRFPPDFVVTSVFTNDFGDVFDVPLQGKGDWEEGRYWLEKISQYCRSHDLVNMIVCLPFEPHMLSRRRAGYYPGLLSNALEINSLELLDPTDDFINAHLELVIEGQRKGKRPSGCPLFNFEIGDGHFSPAGSETWAAIVGKRLMLLLQQNVRYRKAFGLAPLDRAAGSTNMPASADATDQPATQRVSEVK